MLMNTQSEVVEQGPWLTGGWPVGDDGQHPAVMAGFGQRSDRRIGDTISLHPSHPPMHGDKGGDRLRNNSECWRQIRQRALGAARGHGRRWRVW
ncbi:hypothetical protein E2562_013638 [Oryza meyeriana var. granulata]|uniref:Uncharacterized protein n=1 Tax=Oryza meyeriana var. granulata TaxID=110450 RepID=A0A6G1F805_9ORYZ|nr:hypothetical protein E2562_013638 [Oryza meyeriana var. granulata]